MYGVTSKVTSDCLVDCLAEWWETVRERFAHITTLVLNLDNGAKITVGAPNLCSGSSPSCSSISSQSGWLIISYIQQVKADRTLLGHP